MFRVMIVDGMVTCPQCECAFKVAQNKSVGAQYAKDWDSISEKHKNFLLWWISSEERRYKEFEKSELLEGFKHETGLPMSEDGFNARMSEMLSAGTLYGDPLVTRTKNVKDFNYHTRSANTTGIPLYRLNVQRVKQVLNNQGRLR